MERRQNSDLTSLQMSFKLRPRAQSGGVSGMWWYGIPCYWHWHCSSDHHRCG
jgi:hypothetical protein